MKICSVEGCGKKHKCAGLCDTHYAYFRRTGIVGQRTIRSLEERLWEKVDKSAGLGPNGDCWEWRGYVHPTGYGQIMIDPSSKKGTNSNRAAYMVSKGEIPEGLWVLHTCDNRLCCNPDHLWLGTPKENTHDMIAKGRRRKAYEVARGEAVSLAKLTEDMVRAIRAEPPMTFKKLGEKYGISAATANKVKLRQIWKHID